jgi:tRNA modification GTPase
VSDIIQAKSKAGVINSLYHLNGVLSSKLNDLKSSLLDIISLLEIDLDFSEENITIASSRELLQKLSKIKSELNVLLNSFNYAKILDGSLRMIIAGRPNVGKSTLMNVLLGEDRVITSPVAGTTRDTIHENLLIDNVYFKVVDTAGLREAGDHIEIEGIKRTKKQFALADIILLVEDVSADLSQGSCSLLKNSDFIDFGKTILVANKTDLGINSNTLKWLSDLNIPLIKIAALNGVGINRLKKIIIDRISKGFEKYSDEIVVTNLRHKEILEKVIKFINNAEKGMQNQLSFEFVTIDLRAALDSIGEITGEIVSDDILNNIFSHFCIGK